MVSGFAGGSNSWFRKVRCCLRARPIPFGRWPSSVCFAATFPLGEGFFGWYHSTKLYCVDRAFPWGEGGPAKPGRMRATPRKHSVVYQRRPPTPQKRDRPRPVSFLFKWYSSRSQRSLLWLTFPARSSRGCRAGRSTARTWCRSCS